MWQRNLILRVLSIARMRDQQSGARRRAECVARPDLRKATSRPFSWKNENVIIFGQENGISHLARDIAAHNASVTFHFLLDIADLYRLPLEQYTMAIMTSGSPRQDFDVLDIGGILRRGDPNIKIVWVSTTFTKSEIAGPTWKHFCDLLLALPATAKYLASFFENPQISE